MNLDVVRDLTAADAEQVHRLGAFPTLSAERLAVELSTAEDYRWLGLAAGNGLLHAVHRSMRWGNHLLLKGVYVAGSARGSDAALRLGFALRNLARAEGYAGVAVWVEPHQPEAAMAGVLRLRQRGPLVHRFEVPADGSENRVPRTGAAPSSGTIELAVEPATAPMVPNLLGAGPGTVHWVVDGSLLVLSALPCARLADLPGALATIRALAGDLPVRAVEIPVPAADLMAAFFLAGIKARRLSRTPVRIGRLDFPVSVAAERHEATRAGASSC